jgi:hypothetical protein
LTELIEASLGESIFRHSEIEADKERNESSLRRTQTS